MNAAWLLKKELKPKTLEECWDLIEKLAKGYLELAERLETNSQNSSLPPSKSKNKKKSIKKNKSSKKAGGQPGHKGVSRKLVPSEQVDKIIVCEPQIHCDCCNKALSTMNKTTRYQVYEIPKIKYEITEYQVTYKRCSCCNKKYSGKLPKGVGKRGFGTKTHAMLSLLTTKFRLSKLQALSLLKDVYGMPISVGSISNVENRVSKSIAPIYSQIKESINNSKVVNIDETGFKQKNKNGWAWILCSKNYSFFHLDLSRGKKIAKYLIGNFHKRIFISDRYLCYDYLPENNHQVCWAHLKRDFKKISERPGFAGIIGKDLLKAYGRIYAFYKSNSNVKFNRSRRKKRYLKNVLIRYLNKGTKCSHSKTSNTCKNILSQGKSLWLFLDNDDVDSTNNLAERQLRSLVIYKKLSFGVKSELGARFIERAFSLIQSCRQQNLNALHWLTESISRYFCGDVAPIFVPT